MAVIGVTLKINVAKIDKSKLYKGTEGTYLDVTAFVDTDNQDKFGNNGMITQSVSKEEREAGTRGVILGNSKVFFQGESKQGSSPKQAQSFDELESDVPF
jgi:hypothetical protein